MKKTHVSFLSICLFFASCFLVMDALGGDKIESGKKGKKRKEMSSSLSQVSQETQEQRKQVDVSVQNTIATAAIIAAPISIILLKPQDSESVFRENNACIAKLTKENAAFKNQLTECLERLNSFEEGAAADKARIKAFETISSTLKKNLETVNKARDLAQATLDQRERDLKELRAKNEKLQEERRESDSFFS